MRRHNRTTAVTSSSSARNLVASRTFDRDTATLGAARKWLRDTFEQFDITASLTDAELMLSELLTNVIMHTDSTPFVTVEQRPSAVWVAVRDNHGDTNPVPHHPNGAAIGGRGLMIIETLARRWGIDRDITGRKQIWFEIAHTDRPDTASGTASGCAASGTASEQRDP
jgi:anti-sigma regulatory factor (Ser/Thr protein kinase)